MKIRPNLLTFLLILIIFVCFNLSHANSFKKVKTLVAQPSLTIAYTTNTWGQIDPCPA